MADTPTYLELADGLAAEFGSVGDRVPSEHDIASAHGVARQTARAALQELERRYLVRRIRGAGTFVSRRIDYVISDRRPPSASATLRAAGVEPVSRLIETRSIPCPADIAVHLDIERRTPVLRLRRTMTVNGLLTSSAASYLPAETVPGLVGHLARRGSLFDVLVADYGIELRRRWSRASLELPPPSVVEVLQLEGCPPTWLLERVTTRRHSPREAIEFNRTWMRADVCNVTYEMGDPPDVVHKEVVR